jgi:SAM-dependent methyltransferase
MMQQTAARIAYENCPLCLSSRFEALGEADCSHHPLYKVSFPDTLRWLQCSDCGHQFTDGYFSDQAVSILFEDANDYQLLDISKMEQARAVSAAVVDTVSQTLNAQQGRWLDVGFGNGSLLITCAEYGFEPVGVDLRMDAVERVSALGIKAHCMEFTQLEEPGLYSVISMADVLEHMPFPRTAIAKARELLAPGGVFFISCPNSESIVWKALTDADRNPYWQELEHYHNFGRERLYALLREHGLKPVNYSVSHRYRLGMEIISVKE